LSSSPFKLIEDRGACNWRSSYKFLFVFYLNLFFGGISYTIVMPSLYAYVTKIEFSHEWFAFGIFIYSAGEFLGSLIFG